MKIPDLQVVQKRLKRNVLNLFPYTKENVTFFFYRKTVHNFIIWTNLQGRRLYILINIRYKPWLSLRERNYSTCEMYFYLDWLIKYFVIKWLYAIAGGFDMMSQMHWFVSLLCLDIVYVAIVINLGN